MTDGTAPQVDASEWERIGSRLRDARTARGMSARELARRVGVSPQHVSQVERGIGSFSAGVLYEVAGQLGLSLDGLFGHEHPVVQPDSLPAPLVEAGIVLRARDRPEIHLRGGPVWQRLTAAPEGGVEFLETIYAPFDGVDADSGLTRHEGREYGVVLSGALHVQVGFESATLLPGDSIAFDSMTPHRFRSAASSETRAVWFVLEGGTHHPASSDEGLRRRYELHAD